MKTPAFRRDNKGNIWDFEDNLVISVENGNCCTEELFAWILDGIVNRLSDSLSFENTH